MIATTQCRKKWKGFCRKIDTKTDDFSDVLNTIEAFLTEPLSAAVGKYAFTQKWFANSCVWNNIAFLFNIDSATEKQH